MNLFRKLLLNRIQKKRKHSNISSAKTQNSYRENITGIKNIKLIKINIFSAQSNIKIILLYFFS